MYRKTNEELFEESEQALYREAIRETDQEIFDDAFNRDPEDNDGDDSLEQMEGFDGQPLSWDDMYEGPNENGFDRPASLRADEQLLAENQQLREAYADLNGRVDQVINGPERQAQLQSALRDRLYEKYGMLPTDDGKAEAFLSDLARADAVTQAANNDRVNRSMGAAHAEYGADFEEAFRSFTSMDPRNPTARALAADVMNAPDPGERLMALHSNGIHGGLSRGGRASSDAFTERYGYMGARGSSRGGGRRDMAEQDTAYTNRSIEEDIFASAFED